MDGMRSEMSGTFSSDGYGAVKNSVASQGTRAHTVNCCSELFLSARMRLPKHARMQGRAAQTKMWLAVSVALCCLHRNMKAALVRTPQASGGTSQRYSHLKDRAKCVGVKGRIVSLQ